MSPGVSTTTVEVCQKPVFVIGAPRSGTSILAWSLAHHPEFWTSQETEFLIPFVGGADTEAYAAGSTPGRGWFEDHDVSLADFRSYIGIGMNALLTSSAGGKRWIDQTPGYTYYGEALAQTFPNALFLHIVRDGRAAVRSMMNFRSRFSGAQTLPLWAASFEVAVETWVGSVRAGIEHVAMFPERAMTVRNEDIVRDPHAWFKRIFDFLGAERSSDPANFFATSRLNSSFGPDVWGGSAAETPSSSEVMSTSWRFSPGDEAHFRAEAGDLNLDLGY